MFFDDDLLGDAFARQNRPDIGAGAPAADFADGARMEGTGSGAASSIETLTASNPRRKRGSRGGSGPKTSSRDQTKRWRSGAVPQPPTLTPTAIGTTSAACCVGWRSRWSIFLAMSRH